MDKEIAKHIVKTSLEAQDILGHIALIVQSHGSPAECKTYAEASATAISLISLELDQRIYAAFPEMKDEVAQEIKKYDRLL